MKEVEDRTKELSEKSDGLLSYSDTMDQNADKLKNNAILNKKIREKLSLILSENCKQQLRKVKK